MPKTPIQDQSCILGVIKNGVSFKIDTLKIEDDQSKYDYICNVSSASYNNGNGTFTISILNKDFIEGLPIGKWTLMGGRISFSWVSSTAYFYLIDENGDKTNSIDASKSYGSERGFNIEAMARSIFTKALGIVAEYPSAKIYNALSDFFENIKKPSSFSTIRFTVLDSFKAITEYKKSTLEPLINYFEKYQEVFLLLDKSEDPRSKRLLDKAINECKQTLVKLHEKE